MGPYIYLLIFSSYVPYLIFGINNGLNLFLTRINTRNKNSETIKQLFIHTSTTLALIFGLVYGGANFLIYFSEITIFSNLVVSIALILLPLSIILEILLRSNNEFFKLSMYKFFTAIISLLSLFLIQFEFGVYLRYFCITLVSFLFLIYHTEYQFKIKLNTRIIKLLFKKGFPIFIVATLWGIYYTSDRLIIGLFFENSELGKYNLAIIVSSFGMALSSTYSQILYVNITREYEKNKDINSLVPIVSHKTFQVASMLFPFYVLGTILMKPIIFYVMPMYVVGITSAQFILWSTFFMSISLGQDVFIVIDKIKYYYFIVIITFVSFLLMAALFLNILFSIEMVALAFLVSSLFFFILVNYFFLKLTNFRLSNYIYASK